MHSRRVKELDEREAKMAKREQDGKDGFKKLLEDERTVWATEKLRYVE